MLLRLLLCIIHYYNTCVFLKSHMSEIVLGSRFSFMYHVSHMFCNFTIIIFSRGLSFYRILIDTDWNRSVEEATWYLWHALTSLKCCNFIFFFNKELVKIYFNFSLPYHILDKNSSTFASLRYFKLNLLTKSFFLFTNSISYISFYSVTNYCTCGFPICKSFWEVCRIKPWTKT